MTHHDLMKKMYYAQEQQEDNYQPLITNGLVVWDPLVRKGAKTRVGGNAMTWMPGATRMEVDGVECMGYDFAMSIGGRLLAIDPTGMPYGQQAATYALWTRGERLAEVASKYKATINRGTYVGSGTPRRVYVGGSTDSPGKTQLSLSGQYGWEGTPYIYGGDWVHVAAVVLANRSFRFYLNGARKLVQGWAMDMPQDAVLYIDTGDHGGLNCFRNLYVFNRYLTDAEIGRLAQEALQ